MAPFCASRLYGRRSSKHQRACVRDPGSCGSLFGPLCASCSPISMVCGPPGINAHAFGATVLLPHSAPYGAVGPRIDMGQMWGCGGLQGWEGRYWGSYGADVGLGGNYGMSYGAGGRYMGSYGINYGSRGSYRDSHGIGYGAGGSYSGTYGTSYGSGAVIGAVMGQIWGWGAVTGLGG